MCLFYPQRRLLQPLTTARDLVFEVVCCKEHAETVGLVACQEIRGLLEEWRGCDGGGFGFLLGLSE